MADAPQSSLFSELKRRRVFKVTGVYLAAAFAVLQGVDLAVEPLQLPSWTMTLLWALVLAGFPLALVLAWAFELTPEGVRRTEPLPATMRQAGPRMALGFTLGLLVALTGAYALARRAQPGQTADDPPRENTAALDSVAMGSRLRSQLVAVAPLENRTGDTSLAPLGPMVADWITRGLTESGVAEVADFSLDAAPVTDNGSLRALAQQTGAGLVISGSYYREGDDVLMVARVTDARTGRVLTEAGPVRAPATKPLAGVERVRSLVAGILAVHLDPHSPLSDIPGRPPPSFEAYRAFLEVGDQRGQQARDAYRRALSLDSTFFPAAVALAHWYANTGGCAEVDSIVTELERRRARVSEYDRLHAESEAAYCRNDLEGAYRIWQRIAAIAPGSLCAQFTLAVAAKNAGHVREGVERLERMDPTRGCLAGSPWWYEHLIRGLHFLGRYDEELQVAERGRRDLPDEPFRWYLGARGLGALGRTEEMETRIEEFRRSGTANTVDIGTAYREAADELAFHGHLDASRAFAQHALAALTESPERGTFVRVAEALTLFQLERWPRARALLDSIPLGQGENPSDWAEYTNDGAILAFRGVAAAKGGDAAAARAWLAAIGQVPDSAMSVRFGGRELYEAQVLAALGERAAALRRLAAGQARGALPSSDPFLVDADPRLRDLWHDPRLLALIGLRE